MHYVGDGPRSITGDDDQIRLDELASLLLEQRAHAAAGRQRLADTRAAEVTHDAAGVDPGAHERVLRERLVGLVEEEPGMGEAARAAVDRERVAYAVEVLGGARVVVRVDRRAE